MSNIYINEPPTTGKVLLKTTVGDIDIELWCKETPKACRNFIQLCLEDYYNDTIFHRVVKDFIVQGGDPTGTGLGGESIYGEPFKDEFHSRLRFERRGLVALANAGNDDNGSQFFFTMAAAPELNKKHTIFGKVTGNTIFNMLKLQDTIVDQNERPTYPQKILKTDVLKNPFDDIFPREIKTKKIEEVKVVSKSKATKNFNLLSFGDEAEEEEEEINQVIQKDSNKKSKSLHDLIHEPGLSCKVAVEPNDFKKRNKTQKLELKEKQLDISDEEDLTQNLKQNEEEKKIIDDELDDEKEEDDKYFYQKKQMEIAKQEINFLKKEILIKKKQLKDETKNNEPANETVQEFKKNMEKYKNFDLKKILNREEHSLMLLQKFKNKIKSSGQAKKSLDNTMDSNWLGHKLQAVKDEDQPILAKDANLRKDEDWYDIYDPRNPINKQRRETDFKNKKLKK